MSQRTRRSGRILAPIALLGVIAALYVVVNGSDVEKKGKSATTTTQTTKRGHRRRGRRGGRLPSRTYIVKKNDTLERISGKVGVPAKKLKDLNPDLDSLSLIAGQRIKLK